jgi:hypothetical protein
LIVSESRISKVDKAKKYNYVIPTVGPKELRKRSDIIDESVFC